MNKPGDIIIYTNVGGGIECLVAEPTIPGKPCVGCVGAYSRITCVKLPTCTEPDQSSIVWKEAP